MTHRYPLVDIKDTPPADPRPGIGAEVRVAIGGHNDSPTAAIHWTASPGGGFAPYINRGCEEIVYYLSGGGTDGNDTVGAGHCRAIPKGTAHSYANPSDEETTTAVSFLIGAADFDQSEHELLEGQASEDDQSILVHVDDVTPENMAKGDGWLISDFRLPFGAHNGCSSTLFRARFLPGAVHKKHTHEACDEIYYVISGHGLAGAGDDRVEVRGGQFHYIPKGVEHWLHNLSDTDPIEVVGVYIGAGTVAETEYTYKGDVTEQDLVARTGGS
ncbi:MAG: cupin domain-containing protein [Rhodospirillaceae bacterium]|jgi:mannose-6-phosphate isomerase-like protein (cupin superfamily)|nr:cupin domain-containing protein [Rhodospirillaceae bacterium]MBT7487481.1 cupin domain-containing protein [Rhodospirillales bacterium]MBT4700402.1 cupin domain-containing protein [Rhodospirillaceae bacterium]MBT5033897.1 cupin domain-containing protein [Rhodospirillaceae bacterium]MBT6220439.1 cupin domain-containing protein [Rhodospirillaceae bacterium]